MPGPYSLDLRERVVAAVAGGSSCRAAAVLFQVSVSTVVKWAQRWRSSGSVAAKAMGGDNSSRLRGEDASFVLALVAAEPDLTLEEIRGRLRAHFERAVAQRLGYLLERLGHTERALALHDYLFAKRSPRWVNLEPPRRGRGRAIPRPVERNERWRVTVPRHPVGFSPPLQVRRKRSEIVAIDMTCIVCDPPLATTGPNAPMRFIQCAWPISVAGRAKLKEVWPNWEWACCPRGECYLSEARLRKR